MAVQERRLSSGARFVVAHVHLVGTFEIRELVATLLLPRAGAILQPEVPITSKWRACDGNERCIGARPVWGAEIIERERVPGRGVALTLA